jgi:hypothetical protein
LGSKFHSPSTFNIDIRQQTAAFLTGLAPAQRVHIVCCAALVLLSICCRPESLAPIIAGTPIVTVFGGTIWY